MVLCLFNDRDRETVRREGDDRVVGDLCQQAGREESGVLSANSGSHQDVVR